MGHRYLDKGVGRHPCEGVPPDRVHRPGRLPDCAKVGFSYTTAIFIALREAPVSYHLLLRPTSAPTFT